MNPQMRELIQQLLQEIGEDPKREGLQKTPERVEKALRFLTKGYAENPVEILSNALFVEDYDEMVIVKDIDFYSMCEHHLLPFFGRAHVAYIPRHRIVGLSKVARLIEIFSRRLQVQERMTSQISETIFRALDPYGVGVVIEAQHLCMMMRGVEKQNSIAITSSMLGTFRTNVETRMEFMELIKGKRSL
jgi:GTP cyclohydrolase I